MAERVHNKDGFNYDDQLRIEHEIFGIAMGFGMGLQVTPGDLLLDVSWGSTNKPVIGIAYLCRKLDEEQAVGQPIKTDEPKSDDY